MYLVKLGFTGVYIIFLISAQNIDCGYSLEPPRRGGSNEYPQSMFWPDIWKKDGWASYFSFIFQSTFQLKYVKSHFCFFPELSVICLFLSSHQGIYASDPSRGETLIGTLLQQPPINVPICFCQMFIVKWTILWDNSIPLLTSCIPIQSLLGILRLI